MSISIQCMYAHTTIKIFHSHAQNVSSCGISHTQLTQKHLFVICDIQSQLRCNVQAFMHTSHPHIYEFAASPTHTRVRARAFTHSIYDTTNAQNRPRTHILHCSDNDDNNSILLAFTPTLCLSFINCLIFSTPAYSHLSHLGSKARCTQTITMHA